MLEKRHIVAFGVAFIIGASVFSYMGSVLSPTADLFLTIEGIDTDLGVTTIADKNKLAEASWWNNPSKIRVDPDRKGDEIFTTRLGDTTITDPLSRDVCLQPDIIVTITEPQPVIKGDPKDHTTPKGERFKLYKTIFEVVLKTDADLYAGNAVIGEIAYQVEGQIGFIGVQVSPPFGAVWEGDAYVEYELRNHPEGFIYEAYINKDPRVGAINEDGIYTNLNLEAPAIKPIADAHQESQSALSFYDKLEGNEVTDFMNVRTPRGIIPLGGKLGVGADPIMEKHTWPKHDQFKGWNIYNVAIKYQVAVWVALPIEETIDADGNELDPEEVLDGSKHEEEMGDPPYFQPNVADKESGLDEFFRKAEDNLAEINKTIQLAILAVIVIGVSIIGFYVFMWVFPRKR